MKNFTRIFLPVIMIMFAGTQLSGQCEPDTVNCKDTDEPGQICPNKLSDGMINQAYEAVITVIPPGEYDMGGNIIPISYIEIDSVANLPDGISYTPNTDKFWADTAYCVLFSGTPTEAGEFPLAIYVTPWVLVMQNYVPGEQVVDDSSVVMTVQLGSGYNGLQSSDFRVLPSTPNPFPESMRLGFYTPLADQVELEIYSILGKRVCREVLFAAPGECAFSFNGSSLQAGTYFYKIRNLSGIHTGKFIKAKR